MAGHLKHAAELASSTGLTAPSPIPTPSVAPTFAPGKKGPAGLAPRTNYTRVNTGEPPTADAGASAQKSLPPRGAEMLPKFAGGEGSMGNIAGRATLQDLVKTALAESAAHVSVTAEAQRQAANLGEKTAAAAPEHTAKIASAQQVEKLASALDFLAEGFRNSKEAGLGGPYTLSEGTAAPPPGVSTPSANKPLPDKKGQGVNIVPMNPGTQKGLPGEHGGTQMANNLSKAPGGREHMIQRNQGGKTASVADIVRAKLTSSKTASSPAQERQETEGLREAKAGVEKAEAAHKSEPENKEGSAPSVDALADYLLSHTKQAEDAINPAQISAGAAVPPDTSAAGQPGGKPAGGMPQGPTGLVGSNDAAKNYTKGQAYTNRKEDLGKYWNEPALSAQHDSVLQDAFQHTSQAGPKIASAEGASSVANESSKAAAARVLMLDLAKSAEAEIAKTAAANNKGKQAVGFMPGATG